MSDQKELLVEALQNKWNGLLESDAFDSINDQYRRQTTAVLLENQHQALKESSQHSNVAGNVDNWDPILMSLVRRAAPNMIAYDLCGVQPMTGPTGLIFALRAVQGTSASTVADAVDNEALFGEAKNLAGSTNGGVGAGDIGPTSATSDYSDWSTRNSGISIGRPFSTQNGESLGSDGGGAFGEMTFNIDKTSVDAKTRALKAEYTMELQQDLKAIHGLDAETELANMLSTEILAEINREVIRTIYNVAKTGSQKGTNTQGIFDLDVDSNGRWSVERFKGLMFHIDRECNAIAKETRRGKGNFMICSSDVASALASAGVLDYNPALNNNLQVDDTGNTFAGTLNGRIKVYVDPYFSAGATNEYLCVGYKGANAMDAGLFYCPYVPLQMVRAVGEDTFQPKIGFKTRYGLVSNPFVLDSNGAPDAQNLNFGRNQYYRFSRIDNLA